MIFGLQLLFIGLPAVLSAILHMIIVKLDLLRFLKIPIDFGIKLHGNRIFGDSKTWRGLIVMVAFCILFTQMLYIITEIYPALSTYLVFDFTTHSPSFYGLMLGIGYALFELPNSFYKRRCNIKEGTRGSYFNIIIDQADSVIGCFLMLYFFCNFSLGFMIAGIIIYTCIHLFFNFTLFLVGVRKNPL